MDSGSLLLDGYCSGRIACSESIAATSGYCGDYGWVNRNANCRLVDVERMVLDFFLDPKWF